MIRYDLYIKGTVETGNTRQSYIIETKASKKSQTRQYGQKWEDQRKSKRVKGKTWRAT
jgi:hypothetical protein